MKNDLPELRIGVVGAGPIGLAAAAHIIERGLEPIILEAGPSVAAHLESYRHVQLFSPWRYNVDPAARRMLLAVGWEPPPDDELFCALLLQPVAAETRTAVSSTALAERLRRFTRNSLVLVGLMGHLWSNCWWLLRPAP